MCTMRILKNYPSTKFGNCQTALVIANDNSSIAVYTYDDPNGTII